MANNKIKAWESKECMKVRRTKIEMLRLQISDWISDNSLERELLNNYQEACWKLWLHYFNREAEIDRAEQEERNKNTDFKF